jgi:flagellar motor switch protein FliM
MGKAPLISPEEVASVLDGGAARGAAPAGVGRVDATTEVAYSLRRPVAIAPEAEKAARARLSDIAAALEATLRAALEAEVTISVTGFQQEQAHAAVETLPGPGWILAFLADAGGVALAVDPACALSLVELALGGAGNSPAKGREPTPLESRVMHKLCAALVDPLAKRGGFEIRAAAFRTGSLPEALAAPGQIVCVGVLGIGIGGHQGNALLLATPNLLREVREDEDGAGAVGPLAPRLDRVLMALRPVLPAGRVTLSDLMHLTPGAVLRLDAAADAAIELRVSGRTCFRGRIVREGEGASFRVEWRRGRSDAGAIKPGAGPVDEKERRG